MAEVESVRSGVTSGFIVDVPEVRALIEETKRLTSTIQNDAERVEALKPAFQTLLQANGWLPNEYAQTGDTTGMGGGIAAYALYRDPGAALCLFAFVIPSGKTTPVHDHGSWGLVGLYRGRQLETYYRRTDDGSVAGHAVLEQMEQQTLEQGDFYPLLPGARDIHSVGSDADGPTISIHVLANDTGCVQRRQYDLVNQTVKPFRSVWSNVPCSDPAAS
ncbi:MAG: cysteine dioxygenase family protein [Chloroflexia bacterium]|nr:cysteine dioxygenase family protein [Chloroflexia bacterium]